jgi:hypothetical protein
MSTDEQPTQVTVNPSRANAFHRLSIFLSMDFGVVALLRNNFSTRRPTCIWGDWPSVEAMQRQASTYIGKIGGLDLTGVEWKNSDVLLAAVNRPKMQRPTYDPVADNYR